MDMTTAIRGEKNQDQNRQRMNDRVIGKSLKCIQTSLPVKIVPSPSALTRAYFQRMRAAEMAAWEMTGGDYVLPSFAAQA